MSLIRLILPASWKRFLRLWQHNLGHASIWRRGKEISSWRAFGQLTKLAIGGQGLLDYQGGAVLMRVKDYRQLDHLRTMVREPGSGAWVDGSFKTGDVMYDIGANVGSISFFAWAHTRGDCTIYAFDPGYNNFAALCENIYLNRAERSIIPFPVALGAETEILNFQYTNLAAGYALHTLEDPRKQEKDTNQYVFRHPTLVFNLDEFVERFKLKMPNHIKLDVDGGELQVLKGASKTLRASSLRTIQLEIKETSVDAPHIFAIVKEAGFEIKKRNPSKTPDTPNYIFEKRS